jgi:hypothetical protein
MRSYGPGSPRFKTKPKRTIPRNNSGVAELGAQNVVIGRNFGTKVFHEIKTQRALISNMMKGVKDGETPDYERYHNLKHVMSVLNELNATLIERLEGTM